MNRFFLTLLHILLIQYLFSQKFINGSFENNTAGVDQINLSNIDLNAKMPGITAFGSYGDVDIIRSSTYGGGGAQDRDWYIAITGGGTDIVALALSQPLVKGKIYSLSFYDRKDAAHVSYPIQIGASNTNSSFGTTIYTSPAAPVLNIWTKRTFTFTTSEDIKFITVQMQTGGISDWANIDNFVFGDAKCNGVLTVVSSASVVTKGEAVTFIVNGGNSYTWTPSPASSCLTGSLVVDRPQANTIYTVSSALSGCDNLTGTVAVSVKEIVKDTLTARSADTIKAVHVEVKPQFVKFTRRKLNGRRYKIQETVKVAEASVKIMVWDRNKVDGDIVCIYLNGQLLAENLEVSKIKKEITANLKVGKNIIVMYAVNLGRLPPNTAAIGINNHRHQLITLVSDLKKSAALEIIYDPAVLALK